MSKGIKAAVSAVISGGRALGRNRKAFNVDALVDEPDVESRLLVEPAHFKEALILMLRAAEHEIALEFYIVEDDEFTADVMAEVDAALARGVKVRMIADGLGARAWLQSKNTELRAGAIQVRVYHPLPGSPWRSGDIVRGARDFFKQIVTFNRRDHRKLVLVDGRCAILGSHNLWHQSLQWHEASLMVSGASAAALQESFERVWLRTRDLDGRRQGMWRSRLETRGKRRLPAHEGVLDNTTRRFARIRSKAIMALIARAKERVWITTPYLWPHRSMLRLIKARARAGVDVKLIVPRLCDVHISRWMAQTLYSDLLKAGIVIHEFTGSVLHAKVMVVDDRFLIGSSNLNHRSFLQDLEIDFLGKDPALLDALVTWKHRTLASCEEVTDPGQVELHLFKRCMAGLLWPLRGYF